MLHLWECKPRICLSSEILGASKRFPHPLGVQTLSTHCDAAKVERFSTTESCGLNGKNMLTPVSNNTGAMNIFRCVLWHQQELNPKSWTKKKAKLWLPWMIGFMTKVAASYLKHLLTACSSSQIRVCLGCPVPSVRVLTGALGLAHVPFALMWRLRWLQIDFYWYSFPI